MAKLFSHEQGTNRAMIRNNLEHLLEVRLPVASRLTCPGAGRRIVNNPQIAFRSYPKDTIVAASSLIRGLREQIVVKLRDDIMAGRLEPGERLSETKLADRFGVSRGPIREALVQLTNEGFLVGKPNCGVTIASSAPDSVRELIVPIRRTIEIYALRQFFDSITDDDFRAWEEIVQRMHAALKKKDYNSSAEADIAFHRSLLVRAEQPDLLAIWQTIVARIRSHFRQSHLAAKDPLSIYHEHRNIVETFRKGDKEAAVKVLEDSIE